MNKTPIEEIIRYIEARLLIFPDTRNVYECGSYDTYMNILFIAMSKLSFEKKIMQQIFEGVAQNVGTCIKKEDLPSFDQYYEKTFENKDS